MFGIDPSYDGDGRLTRYLHRNHELLVRKSEEGSKAAIEATQKQKRHNGCD